MTKGKHPGGRPTKYKDEFVQMANEYIEKCQDTETTFHKTQGASSDGYDRIIKANLPSKEGFALYIGIATSTLDEWAKKYTEFSGALGKIHQEQRNRLINKGLSGDYNSTIAKLILSANHGMAERSDITSGDEKIIPQIVNYADTVNSKDSV